MNMQKMIQCYNCGMQVANRIGWRNIFFFGAMGVTFGASYFLEQKEKPYYGFRIFKRVKPTETVYEHPY